MTTKKQLQNTSPIGEEINTDNEQSSTKEIEIDMIKGTPFGILRKDEKFSIVMGNNRLSEWEENEEDVWHYYEANKVNIILTAAIIAFQRLEEMDNPAKGKGNKE